MHWLLIAQLWTGFPVQSGEILHGNWQSCRQDNGYGENIYEHTHIVGSHIVHDWDLHLGPYNEFAVYRREADPILDWLAHDDGSSELPDHNHERDNLLGPFHTVVAEFYRGKRTWTVPSFGLWINVVLAGGSREDCESFVVLIKKLGTK